MSRIFEKDAKITHLITLSVEKARALEDPIRAAMLDLLSEKPMSVEEITKELRKLGKKYNKAPTTIRHHLDILKESGLVELVKVEEAGGAVLKYYAAKAKFYGYEVPQDFEEIFGDAIKLSADKLADLMNEIAKKYREKIKHAVNKLKPCPYCSTKDFEEYVILEIIQRAIADAVSRSEFLKKDKQM